MPTGTVRLNTFCTSGGGAAVVRSKSWFGTPRRLSRIAPPTHHVSKPASSSFLAILRTSAGIGSVAGNDMDQFAPRHGRGARHPESSRVECPGAMPRGNGQIIHTTHFPHSHSGSRRSYVGPGASRGTESAP